VVTGELTSCTANGFTCRIHVIEVFSVNFDFEKLCVTNL